MNLKVTVDAPRQILVKGRGLDAELGGEIQIRGTTDVPNVGGNFELQRGTFTLGNSQLTFSYGTVTFNGAGLKKKIDPTLDFTASTAVSDATVTVKISGLADAPKIELSSTPDMPQDEIMARLLFGEKRVATLGTPGRADRRCPGIARWRRGRPQSAHQDSENSGTRPAHGREWHRDRDGTGTAPPQNAGYSVEAGRYVSSRVFVAVKESTTGTSQLAVDVDLTKHLKLQTRLGNGSTTAQGTTPENDPGSSIGLAYQFEY